MSCVVFLLLCLVKIVSSSLDPLQGEFSFNGYLSTEGTAEVDSNGLLKPTNSTRQKVGQLFYSFPLQFKDSSSGNVFSFSTTFIFAMVPEYKTLGAHGIAFAVSPSKGIPGAFPSQYLGLFNTTGIGSPSNHIIAIELDTIQSDEFDDIDDNHVGIDINSLISVKSAPAGYFDDGGRFNRLQLISGNPMQVWVEYNSTEKELNVTLHPIHVSKPKLPLLSLKQDLSQYILDLMYVGFTSSTGSIPTSHYILGWTFNINGKAPDIDLSRLPKLPRFTYGSEGIGKLRKILAISLSLSGFTFLLVLILVFLLLWKRKKFMEVLEDWEVQYGPHRFTYKDLFFATKGFRNTELIGKGGFGEVYHGVLPVSNIQIAVKRISHDSRQGMREFVAEIATIGRLRHPNLVRLLGYCRRRGELYLVYDFMPNGSLDKFLYHQLNRKLDWTHRFKIIKDVASALFYLHQQWVQVVIHRDIKPANVLIDGDMNARLGDFGLAKLCDHGNDPLTTHVAGTLGYMSPELARTGKANTCTDIFAFGAFMLEVTCGRRPIERQASQDEMVLVDWTMECWDKGDILKTVDRRLGHDFLAEQADLVLKLGLLCSHPVAAARPSMSSVIQFLDGVAQLPDNLIDTVKAREITTEPVELQPSDDSVAPITFSEPFVSHGR